MSGARSRWQRVLSGLVGGILLIPLAGQVSQDPNAHWLLEGVRTGDLAEVKRIAANAPHLVVMQETGPLLLTLAAREGQPAIVEWLLQQGADPRIAYQGNTPLDAALGWDLATERERSPLLEQSTGAVPAAEMTMAAKRQAMIARGVRARVPMKPELIARKSRVIELILAAAASAKGIQGGGVAGAVYWGFGARTIRQLIEAGADPDELGPVKMPPLHVAIIQNPEVLEVLLDYAKNLERLWMMPREVLELTESVPVDAGGFTPLMLAISEKRIDLVRLLLARGAKTETTSGNMLRALHLAALSGVPEMTQVLLEHGARVDPWGPQQATPLGYASGKGDLESVRLLVKAKADIEAVDFAGFTPLLCAVEKDHLPIVEYLIAAGANWRAKTNQNEGAVRLAAAHNALQTIGLLLQLDGRINGDPKEPSAPLTNAAANGHPTMVRWLLDHGAAVDVEDQRTHGTPLIQLARITTMINSPALKAPAGWRQTVSPPSAYLEAATLLLGAGASVNATDLAGCSALHYAAQSGDKPLAELLLERGARPNGTNRRGQTPRDIAFLQGHPELIELLDRTTASSTKKLPVR